MWVVTNLKPVLINILNISIHTTRVGGDQCDSFLADNMGISIHTTRVGGDYNSLADDAKDNTISIHTTRVGGDLSR